MRTKSRIGECASYSDNLRAALARHKDASPERVSFGLAWYRQNGADLQDSILELLPSDDNLSTIASSLGAILSPATAWGGVLRRLPAFVSDALSGEECPHFPAYRRARRAAARIARGESKLADECKGPKVLAFARALECGGECREVTVDRHMLAIARGVPIGGANSCTLGEYRAVELAVRALTWEALEIVPAIGRYGSIAPAQLQSLIWTLEVGPLGRHS